MIMETEKSHDLPLASRKTRKASGIVPVQTLRGENQGIYVPVWGTRPNNQEHWYLRAKEDGCPNSNRKQIRPFSDFLFYPGPRWIGWHPSELVKLIIFTQSTETNADLFQKYPQRRTSWPSHVDNKLTITEGKKAGLWMQTAPCLQHLAC